MYRQASHIAMWLIDRAHSMLYLFCIMICECCNFKVYTGSYCETYNCRFEPDMLAFSGCYFGGGDKERNELGEIRKRWETLPVRLLFVKI